jgi:hypothetical protein
MHGDTRIPVLVGFDAEGRALDEEGRRPSVIRDPRSAADPAWTLARLEVAEALRRAWQELSTKDRLILSLSFYEGFTQKQIGQVLHITESRISQIRTRALRRLRERIEADIARQRADDSPTAADVPVLEAAPDADDSPVAATAVVMAGSDGEDAATLVGLGALASGRVAASVPGPRNTTSIWRGEAGQGTRATSIQPGSVSQRRESGASVAKSTSLSSSPRTGFFSSTIRAAVSLAAIRNAVLAVRSRASLFSVAAIRAAVLPSA